MGLGGAVPLRLGGCAGAQEQVGRPIRPGGLEAGGELIGIDPPAVISRAEAEKTLSPLALDFRLNGRKCRSLHRADLIGDLQFPTYREGLRDALAQQLGGAAKQTTHP